MNRFVGPIVLSLLLAACGQRAATPSLDPYAAEYAAHPSQPWISSSVSALSLTPGVNTLYYETPTYASSGWGPIEVNRSNGGRAQLDGHPLTLGGEVFMKGYGVHSTSELRYALAGTGATCTRFSAIVGVDDEVGNRGSVVFQVWADGVKLADSGVLRGSDGIQTITADLTGRSNLRLVVTDAGDGNSYDHADWVNPIISCVASGLPDTTPPVLGACFFNVKSPSSQYFLLGLAQDERSVRRLRIYDADSNELLNSTDPADNTGKFSIDPGPPSATAPCAVQDQEPRHAYNWSTYVQALPFSARHLRLVAEDTSGNTTTKLLTMDQGAVRTSAMSPDHGRAGTVVTVTGIGFTADSVVHFGNGPDSELKPIVIDGNRLTFVVPALPPDAPRYVGDVFVTTPGTGVDRLNPYLTFSYDE
ncbi:NPCBM/NEW2 domain-containing protein [Deinococcus sonorensis]|uniref:NPCBM/NEW2 domain-containing protein n=2 Tax=Deinococcus sonorensis TaxID=309891 RepID=A0AAU7U5R3_9DEIO